MSKRLIAIVLVIVLATLILREAAKMISVDFSTSIIPGHRFAFHFSEPGLTIGIITILLIVVLMVGSFSFFRGKIRNRDSK